MARPCAKTGFSLPCQPAERTTAPALYRPPAPPDSSESKARHAAALVKTITLRFSTFLFRAGRGSSARNTGFCMVLPWQKFGGSQPISRVLSLDSHSSRPAVTDRLKQPTRVQRGPRQCTPIWPCSGWGLACRPCCHVRGALLPSRSCPRPPPKESTFSPLPVPLSIAVTHSGGHRRFSSLFHFPSPCGVRPLTGIPPYGARTFLPIH